MLLGSNSLNRATFQNLKDIFEPYNIRESFLKENIEKMIEIKHTKLVKECLNYGIPSTFSNHILEETTIVDELFTKGSHI